MKNWTLFKWIPLLILFLLGGCESLQTTGEKFRDWVAPENWTQQNGGTDSAGGRPTLNSALQTPPAYDEVGQYFIARTGSNLRGGPGTDFVTTGHLAEDERVWVEGKVKGRDWYLVRASGCDSCYLHTSLVTPDATNQPGEKNRDPEPRAAQTTPQPSDRLDSESIRNLVVGKTVTLMEEASQLRVTEFYRSDNNELVHQEDGRTSSGHWSVSGSDTGQFCRNWLSEGKKLGRCYHVLTDGRQYHLLPVFSRFGVERKVVVISILDGNQIADSPR